MTQIIVGENEGIESALRRFKREVSKSGIFPDIRKHVTLKRLCKSANAKRSLSISSVEVSIIDYKLVRSLC